MVNYQNGKIYKLVSNQTNEVYYGSTCQELCERMAGHRRHYMQYQNGKMNYISAFEILKYDDCKIVWVEDYPCDNKPQLFARETEYIKSNECVNKRVPYRNDEEKKESLTAKRKRYWNKHKDEIIEKQKVYYRNNIDRKKDYDKNYNEANRAKKLKQSKEYREKNKDIVRAKQTEKIMCDCGLQYSRSNRSVHMKSNKHIELMKSKPINE